MAIQIYEKCRLLLHIRRGIKAPLQSVVGPLGVVAGAKKLPRIVDKILAPCLQGLI